MKPEKVVKEWLPGRVARLQRGAHRNRVLRLLGARGAAALLLGGVLSVGGLTEAADGVHFLVEKNLDSVRVMRQGGGQSEVVAKFRDGFTANSVFKLSRVLPDALVTQRVALFTDAWLPELESPSLPAGQRQNDVFHTEMARINEAIRRDFFSNAMPYGDIIHEKAQKYDVDPSLVAAVIEQESKFRRGATSQVGARGLMQLMPRTGRWLGARNLYDPEQNVDAGVKYIKYLQERFHGNVNQTIAAYNAGEGNVKRYGGVPPFRETQTYVKKVLRNYQRRSEELRQFSDGVRAGGSLEPDGTLTLR